MASTLDLGRARSASRAARKGAASVLGAIAAWAPVWAPAAFLTQLVVMGALPALEERERLDVAESQVRTRVRALEDDGERLALEARMLADEVYRERVRRSLVDPGAEPLTLERALAER